MREGTNLGWADTPFGAARRPFVERTPLLAAFTVSTRAAAPDAIAAVYLRLPRGRTLTVTDTTLRFGFHALAAEQPAETPSVAARLDALLVQGRRRAAILAGHRLADTLATLATADAPTRGITALAAAWPAQNAQPGLARLCDTAYGPTPPALHKVCAAVHLHGLPTDSDPAAGPASAAPMTSATAPQTLRQVILRALGIALLAARSAGHYQWDRLHLDTIVEAAAWDQTAVAPMTTPPAQPSSHPATPPCHDDHTLTAEGAR
ncbi:hypothetical protein [Frankia sp. BMG5.23]|uniref:hypothetical protein n=1 Tax=Frankia sp. BMG5.23 TaxID=683305 RepID=UPI000460B5CD|nr:hypothetical protein [Frankia sp. BMG5.23]KDA44254.1 hypothetical protein BMG523Draft_00750 [Frankia sp. BMG5.23]